MRKGEDKVTLIAKIPKKLEMEVRILLTDPVTGRISYGEMSGLITGLLKTWVEAKRIENKEEDNEQSRKTA